MFQAKLIIKILASSLLLTVISYISINKNLNTRYDYNIQYMHMPTMSSSAIQKLMIQSSKFSFKDDFMIFSRELDNFIRVVPQCKDTNKGNENKNIVSAVVNGVLQIQIISQDKNLITNCSGVIKKQISIYQDQLKNILFETVSEPTNINLIINLKRMGNLDMDKKVEILKNTIQNENDLKKKILKEFGDQNVDLSDAEVIKNNLDYYTIQEMLAVDEIPEENYRSFVEEYESIKFLDLISETTSAIEINKKIIFLNIFIFFFIISIIFFKKNFFSIYYKKIIKLI